jgi:aryl-alcohol dehydrogenase-like predicted oxidoreductase
MNRVNKLILGTVQMGLDYGINNKIGKINENKAIEILEYAFSQGVRVIDTAEAYGTSHQVIGHYHKLNPSHSFKIITKIPKNINNNLLQSKVNQYLNELKISNIHLLMCHDFETYRNDDELSDWLIYNKGSDYIEKVGVSVYTNSQVMNLLDGTKKLDVIQLPFNLLDNNFQRADVLKSMNSECVITHTRSPFLQGMFFLDQENDNEVYKSLLPYISELYKIANSVGITMHSMALLYSIQNALINNVIIGVDSIDQLKLNLQTISDCFLSEEVIKRIDSIVVHNVDLLNPSLWN